VLVDTKEYLETMVTQPCEPAQVTRSLHAAYIYVVKIPVGEYFRVWREDVQIKFVIISIHSSASPCAHVKRTCLC